MTTSFADMLKATRTNLVRSEEDEKVEMMKSVFGLSLGEYINVRFKPTQLWKSCRIESIDNIYPNEGGGWTANVWVVRLVGSGRLGATRMVTMVLDKGKKNEIRGLPYGIEVSRR